MVQHLCEPTLAAIRQQRGLSLEEIAETTKISIRFLRAIESERFEELPGGIFSTSYLKQYAQCVNCDENELLARWRDKVTPESVPSHNGKLAPEASSGHRPWRRWFRRRETISQRSSGHTEIGRRIRFMGKGRVASTDHESNV
jgi:transcriptional regulator with XRE-family HTH domain